jgi:hypothetical protein
MDTVMKSLFGQMPISEIPSVKAAELQKNNTQSILILGAAAIVLGFVAYKLHKENKELKYKLNFTPVNN